MRLAAILIAGAMLSGCIADSWEAPGQPGSPVARAEAADMRAAAAQACGGGSVVQAGGSDGTSMGDYNCDRTGDR